MRDPWWIFLSRVYPRLDNTSHTLINVALSNVRCAFSPAWSARMRFVAQRLSVSDVFLSHGLLSGSNYWTLIFSRRTGVWVTKR
jgi:hypothetical protein